MLDKLEGKPEHFQFKHHYMLHAINSQLLLQLLTAIGEKRRIRFINASRRWVTRSRANSSSTEKGFVR